MKNNELLDAVGDIDPKLVAEASGEVKKSRPAILRAALPIAACLCLGLGVLAAVKLIGPAKGEDDKTASTGEPAVTETTGGSDSTVTGGENANATEIPQNALPEYHGEWCYMDPDFNGYDPNEARTFISDYPGAVNVEVPMLLAGQVCLSPVLRAALADLGAYDENGRELIYNVRVELFKDVLVISPSRGEAPFPGVDEEAERLFREAGIVSIRERFTDEDEGVSLWSLYLHITAEQLENFPASEEYGYYITLYGETLEDYASESVTFGGTFNGC